MAMMRRICVLILALMPLVVHAEDRVVIGIFSVYQSAILNSKIDAFVQGVGKALQRPAYISGFTDAAGMRRLQAENAHLVVFVPKDLIEHQLTATMTPLVQTRIAQALYAKPADDNGRLTDIKRVSIARHFNTAQIAAELAGINPAIKLVPQDIGTGQLRALLNGSVNGAVLNPSVFENMTPALRDKYVLRYTFHWQQYVDGFVAPAFTAVEVQALRDHLLKLEGESLTQLRRTFGVMGFTPYAL